MGECLTIFVQNYIDITYSSEDLHEAIKAQNSSIADFELGRLITACDNAASVYLTCSPESVIPFGEVSIDQR